MINFEKYIINNHLKILVRPNKKKNNIINYDKEKKALIIEIKAVAKDNKANLEIIKYFSKILNKKVRIKRGLKSKEKVLFIN